MDEPKYDVLRFKKVDFDNYTAAELANGTGGCMLAGKPYIIWLSEDEVKKHTTDDIILNYDDCYKKDEVTGPYYVVQSGLTFLHEDYPRSEAETTVTLKPNGGNENIAGIVDIDYLQQVDMKSSYLSRTDNKRGNIPAGSYMFYQGDIVLTNKVHTQKGYRAWIEMTEKSGQSAKELRMVLDDDTAQGIRAIVYEGGAQGKTFNLAGLQMQGDTLPKGIYVKGGKKMIVR